MYVCRAKMLHVMEDRLVERILQVHHQLMDTSIKQSVRFLARVGHFQTEENSCCIRGKSCRDVMKSFVMHHLIQLLFHIRQESVVMR